MSTQISKLLPAIATFGILLQAVPAVAQTAMPPAGDYYNSNNNWNAAAPATPNYPNYQRGRVTFVPAGLTIPVTLSTAISTDVARPGDMVSAMISNNVDLGGTSIPQGSTVVGTVTDAKSGGFLGRSGMLTVKFNRLRLPNGQEVPLSAHVVGGIGKYEQIGNQSDTFKGETWKNKVGQTALRGTLGAGTGAALGTAIGAIAGSHGMRGRAIGRGAWSGAAIGGGLGVADALLLRKGKNVVIPSGQNMQLQLDAPTQISSGVQTGAF